MGTSSLWATEPWAPRWLGRQLLGLSQELCAGAWPLLYSWAAQSGEAAVTLTGDLLLSQRPQIECSVVENCKGMGRDGKSVVRSALNRGPLGVGNFRDLCCSSL